MWNWLTLENARVFAGPFATVVAAGVAAYFARAQWRVAERQTGIAHDKLKFDLFSKRYSIYAAAKQLIEYVVQLREDTPIDAKFVRERYVALDEARFFFDADIRSLLTQIHRECELFMETLGKRRNMNNNDHNLWIETTEQLAKHSKNLHQIYETLPQRFENGLAFGQLTSCGH